ncbi:CvpA family protein [Guggenheimella bovis]
MTDILILITILLTLFAGYRKNLFRNFFDFFSIFAALVVAFRLFGTFAGFVQKIPGISHILGAVQKGILSPLSSMDEETQFTLKQLHEINMTPEFNYFFKQGSFFREKESIVFTELAIQLITNIIAIILLYLLVFFLTRFIGGLIENSNKMAGLTSIDRTGGIIFSLLKSFIYASLIAIVVHSVASFYNSGLLYDLYHKSILAKFFYEDAMITFFLR